MYGCESWTIKKAEWWRIDAFELWCWRTLLRVPRQQGDPTRPSSRRSVLGVHWKDWCWSWNSNTLATWWEKLTHLKSPWFGERLRARGEGDDRGWDGWMGWMAPMAQWTWVWVNSGSWWWTGGPGILCSVGSQKRRIRLSYWTELKWMEALLEEEMAPHSSILENSMDRGAWWATVHGVTTEWLSIARKPLALICILWFLLTALSFSLALCISKT